MEKETAAIWACTICGKDFPTKALLVEHLNQEMNDYDNKAIQAHDQLNELNG